MKVGEVIFVIGNLLLEEFIEYFGYVLRNIIGFVGGGFYRLFNVVLKERIMLSRSSLVKNFLFFREGRFRKGDRNLESKIYGFFRLLVF